MEREGATRAERQRDERRGGRRAPCCRQTRPTHHIRSVQHPMTTRELRRRCSLRGRARARRGESATAPRGLSTSSDHSQRRRRVQAVPWTGAPEPTDKLPAARPSGEGTRAAAEPLHHSVAPKCDVAGQWTPPLPMLTSSAAQVGAESSACSHRMSPSTVLCTSAAVPFPLSAYYYKRSRAPTKGSMETQRAMTK